jgi:hypothetical protein
MNSYAQKSRGYRGQRASSPYSEMLAEDYDDYYFLNDFSAFGPSDD